MRHFHIHRPIRRPVNMAGGSKTVGMWMPRRCACPVANKKCEPCPKNTPPRRRATQGCGRRPRVRSRHLPCAKCHWTCRQDKMRDEPAMADGCSRQSEELRGDQRWMACCSAEGISRLLRPSHNHVSVSHSSNRLEMCCRKPVVDLNWACLVGRKPAWTPVVVAIQFAHLF